MAEAEVEEGGNTVQLVPDVIMYLIEEYGFLDDIKSVLSFRLISKIWNESLRHLVGTKTVTILSDENLSAFEQLLSSDASSVPQVSNIRSVILNIKCNVAKKSELESSGSSEASYLKNLLNGFVRLPPYFRSQLHRFTLNFEVDTPPDFLSISNFFAESQLDSLDELQILVGRKGDSVPVFGLDFATDSIENIRFQFLRKLTVPLHISLNFLQACSVLKQLSLQVFDMELPPDFWENFNNAVVSNGLNESIEELFFVDKRRKVEPVKIQISCHHLYQCKFQLKKLDLSISMVSRIVGMPSNGDMGSGVELLHIWRREHKEMSKFLIQQSTSLEYLQVEDWEGSFDEAFEITTLKNSCFSKLVEFKCKDFCMGDKGLLPHFPILEKIHLPNIRYWFWANWKSIPIETVEAQYLHPLNWHLVFKYFPRLKYLEVVESIFRVMSLAEIFTHGTALKKLHIKFQFKLKDKEPFGCIPFHPSSYSNSETIKADCFILGQNPSLCKRFQSGLLVCDDTTEFGIPTEPSITNLQYLEHLSLDGYFTEMTLWCGIKELTQLKVLHLKTQHLIHPRTLLKLESHLVQLQTWSYTKLEKNGDREMYKCFRVLPDILKLEKIHVWKFNDDGVEKKVVTLAKFDDLDLSTGTEGDELEDCLPEPESGSDSKTDFSNQGDIDDEEVESDSDGEEHDGVNALLSSLNS